jgi:hypothetical protein
MELATTLVVNANASLDIKDSFVPIHVRKERLVDDAWESVLASTEGNAITSMESVGNNLYFCFNRLINL